MNHLAQPQFGDSSRLDAVNPTRVASSTECGDRHFLDTVELARGRSSTKFRQHFIFHFGGPRREYSARSAATGVTPMKRTRTRIATLAVLALIAAALHPRRTAADPQIAFGAACVSYVPQAWGEYKGGTYQTGLAFEDSKGTLRFVTNVTCEAVPQPALEIRRTASTPN